MACSTLVAFGVGLVLAFAVLKLVSSSKSAGNPPAPPGPKSLPLVGNLSDLPKPGEIEAQHWLKHKDLYGMSLSPTPLRRLETQTTSAGDDGFHEVALD
jgi:hypothetical protein